MSILPQIKNIKKGNTMQSIINEAFKNLINEKIKTRNIKVLNMISPNGNKVANQFVIVTEEGTYFQSYSSVIAFKDNEGQIFLDRNKWDYSSTTGKYRNIFLNENKRLTEKKITNRVYSLADLNS